MITGQRGDILRHNERFMRELSKKMEEVRKLRIEAESKQQKAATTSPEKKPVKVE